MSSFQLTFVCLVLSAVALSFEPRAGADTPFADGLVVHLDASRISDSQKLGPVHQWDNLVAGISGFRQNDAAAQPELLKVGESFVVRFDGDGDHMRSVGTDRIGLTEMSVFVVAAPHRNPGDYSGLVAANAKQQRDYQSGFNLDLGAASSLKLDTINVEGRGFGGARDLLNQSLAFGAPRVFTVIADPQKRLISLRVDGSAAGQRASQGEVMSFDELTLGARYYTNGPGEQQVRCGLDGDIAELLIYDRTLSVAEIQQVETYLTSKYSRLRIDLPATLDMAVDATPLVKAENPPAIQMLLPGFTVREIPVELTNVNNVRFRSDGKLVTLGYNGDIHLLSDTDGDGLEDSAKPFWRNTGSLRGPIGMLLTPDEYVHGKGVFTPSKGMLSLIVDKDGDDVADDEIVVASGWDEITQNVDATGVAMDDEGYLYFGLGTANYANAYLIDDQGTAQYDINSDRGTVQRVSPDFKTRETVCTGIRFPIAFAFNREGDLFCSEQEGATWLANGNPLDELLHIVPDRHYGFPPRHPRHNPDVIDEPSVFDYSPQHQSTCGMVFNQSVNGGPVFGPDWWADSAIVCGESRGKIWRTQLCKSSNGYVASTQLIACLQMLTVDACVAPDGDLVVACHSGPPDWGTGPTGIGKLFRIQMSDPEAARPLLAWPSSQREIQIAFDRPLDANMLKGIADQIVIQYGDHVRAGDSFENLVPPYAVVQRQLLAPRKSLAVRGISVSADRRNVLIQTDAMPVSSHYSISIPYDSGGASVPTDALGQHGQHRQLDIDLTLHGIETAFRSSAADDAVWSGWMPHLDWQVSNELTRQSVSHDELRSMIGQGGVLSMQTKLDLSDILRPKVQPGSTLDYQWPEEQVTLVVRSSQPLTLISAGKTAVATRTNDDRYEVRLAVPAADAESFPLTVETLVKRGTEPDLTVAVSTNEDDRLRALPLRRFFLPWSTKSQQESTPPSNTKVAELDGGNWGAGRRVFHSEAASCWKCHAIHSAGPNIGPDLTNLVHRDYASVLRDIQNPSFAINPDYLGQTVLMNDGRVLTGVLQTKDGKLSLADATGKLTFIDKEAIDTIKPAEVSVMPKGLHEKLTQTQMRDLMTFLLTPAPHMPLDSPLPAPPVRTQAEVAYVLADSQPLPDTLTPLRVVLVAGKKDHGPGEHDYPAWQIQWGQLLAAAAEVSVELAWDFPSDTQLGQADVLIFFQKGTWNDTRQEKMDSFFDRGGGAVYIHWAVNGDDRVADFSDRIGMASRGGSIGYRHGPLSLAVHNTDHPIMRNIEPLQLYDESYWRLTGEPSDVTLFATSMEDGAPQPQLWSYERSAGRVFVSIPGHYNWTFDDPIFRTLLLRGIAWTAKQPVDRFNELVPLGARMSK
ncbi:ThuA domain-containing protein [Stieleria varia]|nr:ThuA domain-containing protein [Stieleria varia]